MNLDKHVHARGYLIHTKRTSVSQINDWLSRSILAELSADAPPAAPPVLEGEKSWEKMDGEGVQGNRGGDTPTCWNKPVGAAPLVGVADELSWAPRDRSFRREDEGEYVRL